jgi:hypothetical protein
MTTSTQSTNTAQIVEAANLFAKSDALFDASFSKVVEVVSRILGAKPSYELYQSTAKSFTDAYQAAKKCSPDTASNRWSFVVSYISKNSELVKPTKPTKTALVKKEQRTKALGEKVALKAQCVNLEDTLTKAQEAIKQGDTKKAMQLAAIAQDFKKSAETVAAKSAKDALSLQRDKIRKALIECNDLAKLKAAYEILLGNVPIAEKSASKAKTEKPKKATPFDALKTVITA